MAPKVKAVAPKAAVDPNVNLKSVIQQALDRIANHVKAKHLFKIPTGLGSLDKESLAKDLKKKVNAVHTWEGPLLLLDVLYTTAPEVEIDMHQIHRIKSFKFPVKAPPTRYPYTVIVAADDKDWQAAKCAGSWKSVSPPEESIAAVLALDEVLSASPEDIEQMGGVAVHAELIKSWIDMMSNVHFEFKEIAPGLDRWYAGQNCREDVTERAAAITYTLTQRVDLVYGFKLWREKETGSKLSAEKCGKMLAKVKQAGGPNSEAYSEHFVKCAINIKEKVMNNPTAMAALQRLQAKFLANSPFKSVFNLQELIHRCGGDIAVIGSVIEVLVDGFFMGTIDKSEFSQNRIRDPSKSIVEVIKLQLGVKEHMLHVLLPSICKTANEKQTMNALRSNFGSIAKFRVNMTPYPGPSGVTIDLSPQRVYSKRQLEFLNQYERLVMSMELIALYKTCAKQSKTYADFIEFPSVSQRFSAINDIPDEIQAGEQKGTTPAPATPMPRTSSLPKVVPTPTKASNGLSIDDDNEWNAYVDKQVRRTVRLLVEPKAMTTLISDLRESDPVKRFHTKGGMTMIYYSSMQVRYF